MNAALHYEDLLSGLKRLKLRRVREILETPAERDQLGRFKDPLTLISHLVSEEVVARDATQLEVRLRAARFPQEKTLADFEFSAAPSVDQGRIESLATLDFIKRAENAVFLGPPGVGKTHLAIALGLKAVHAGFKVRFTTAQALTEQLYAAFADGTFRRELDKLSKLDLVVIDELGYLRLDETASNHLFQVISRAYERQAVIITSNRPFQEWVSILHDPVVVSAILDRLLHHAHLFNLKGDSYRLAGHISGTAKGVLPLPQS